MATSKHLLCILLPTVLLGCSSPSPSATDTDSPLPQTTSHTVISVGDGDTLNVRSQKCLRFFLEIAPEFLRLEVELFQYFS